MSVKLIYSLLFIFLLSDCISGQNENSCNLVCCVNLVHMLIQWSSNSVQASWTFKYYWANTGKVLFTETLQKM